MPVDYFTLLTERGKGISDSEMHEVLKWVATLGHDLGDSDTAFDRFTDLYLEDSPEWIRQRTRITSEAEVKHSNPRIRSDYCRDSIKKMITEKIKEEATRRQYPERAWILRQVCDHLRLLEKKGELCSHMVKSKVGQDLWKMWGLFLWGPNWKDLRRQVQLDEAMKRLNFIEADTGGKGIFDYAGVLPTYIPELLSICSGPLSTSEIAATICQMISPPLAGMSHEDITDSPSQWTSVAEILEDMDLWIKIDSILTDDEKGVLEMLRESTPKPQIAERLRCSLRSVPNHVRRIIDKIAYLLVPVPAKGGGTFNKFPRIRK